MRRDKMIVIPLVISSLLLFSGCNASLSEANDLKQNNSDSAEAIPEVALTERQQTTIKDTSINQKDSQGRKQGLWIEDNGLKEVYYTNGKKNGIYKSYFLKTGKLEVLGWYEQDTPTGSWYYFDETSRLFMAEDKINLNKEKIKVKNDEGTFILLPFKSYIKLYHKNGVLAKEGMALYEDVEMEFFMYGRWKYYDGTGKLIREENYKEGKIAD